MSNETFQHDTQVRDYFEARTAEYDAFYEPSSRIERSFNRVFRKAVYLRRDEVITIANRFGCRSVLDVGCGSGRNMIYWAHNGLERLHGVDVSPEMVMIAKSISERAGVADRCTFDVADFTQWGSDNQYDMVVACGVFDYVVDAESFLAHMARMAKHVIYGSFPGWTLVRSPLRKLRYALRGCPTHFYRRKELDRIFTRVGFGPLEVKQNSAGHLAWSYRKSK